MPNGTALEVLKRNSDGWWYVRVVASGQEGWALSGQKDKRWIVCCAPPSKPSQLTQTVPDRSTQVPAPVSSGPVLLTLTSDGIVFNPEAIANRCLRETGAQPGIMNAPGGAELLKCIEREQAEQAAQLGERACNDNLCIYRLKQVADNTFAGSGYTVKHRISSKPRKFGNQDLIEYESLLTRDDGKQAIMSQTIGPVGSIFFDQSSTPRPKSEITAKYYGPIGVGPDAFVVLSVPQERVADDDKRATAVSLPCQNVPTDLIPCALKWKTVEFKFEMISRTGAFRMDGTEETALKNRKDFRGSRSDKITFSNNDDVFFFTQRDGGFLYKVNLELDFLANRSRAPKGAEYPPCVKLSRGQMDLKNNILSWNRVSEASCGWNNTLKISYQIAFSPDFTACSVAEFSLVDKDVDPKGSGYMLHTHRFAKSLECRIYNAK
jgi:hypothetical protein